MSTKKKLAFLLATSPYLVPAGEHNYSEAVNDLIANGVTVQRWTSVEEEKPKNEVDVLICAERKMFSGGTIKIIAKAFYTDGKMNTEESQYCWDVDCVDMDYDEEADAYIVPEGWWECVDYGEEFSAIGDFVTHWRPLPDLPNG